MSELQSNPNNEVFLALLGLMSGWLHDAPAVAQRDIIRPHPVTVLLAPE